MQSVVNQYVQQYLYHNFKCIVLIGNVGVGKSSIVSTVTGCKDIASSSTFSATKTSMAYPTDKFIIVDTPGNNPIHDPMEHNMQIANGFNLRPVSLLVVCIEAHVRMDQTLQNIKGYWKRFAMMDDILCPMITKMDTVDWSESEFKRTLFDVYGIKRVVFNRIGKSASVLKQDLLAQCSPTPLDITVTDKNFHKYFKVTDNNLKIIRVTNELRDIYDNAVNNVIKDLESMPESERMDLVFQFQQFMLGMIPKMQKKLSNRCNFSFLGSDAALEYGHIANLANKLKNILYKIRVMALGYASTHGVGNLRQCPHCGLIWSKVIGCDGKTTCGNRPTGVLESKLQQFSTFSFSLEPFEIVRTGSITLNSQGLSGKGIGCGKEITWSNMKPVALPSDFEYNESTVSVEDVEMLPKEMQYDFSKYFNENLGQVKYYKK